MDQQAAVQLFDEFRGLRTRQRSERLGHMRAFIEEFAAQHARSLADESAAPRLSRAERFDRMAAFLEQAETILGQSTPPADFNTFDLLRVRTAEVIHTQFIAWLFDREGSHGQGSLFAATFLELCGIELEEDSLRRYHVRPEFSGAEAVIDVMIGRPWDFLVYLENKIDAAEGHDQANREHRDMRRTGRTMSVPLARQMSVFLTPEGQQPTSGDPDDWMALSYERLADVIRRTVTDISDDSVRFIVEHWLTTVTSWR